MQIKEDFTEEVTFKPSLKGFVGVCQSHMWVVEQRLRSTSRDKLWLGTARRLDGGTQDRELGRGEVARALGANAEGPGLIPKATGGCIPLFSELL